MRVILENQRGWTVCGEAGTGREAVARALELQPDITVLDVSMPELNGLEATRQTRRAGAGAVLIMTIYDLDDVAEEALVAGASACLAKADPPQRLVAAVRGVLEGRSRSSLVQTPGAPLALPLTAGRNHSVLSSREREVLQLLAEGRSNKEIGSILGIATKTAETHRARLMAKLGVRSMADLVRYAVRNRIVEP
jgi:DNA-binding NarL/FixJ family response regulator